MALDRFGSTNQWESAPIDTSVKKLRRQKKKDLSSQKKRMMGKRRRMRRPVTAPPTNALAVLQTSAWLFLSWKQR